MLVVGLIAASFIIEIIKGIIGVLGGIAAFVIGIAVILFILGITVAYPMIGIPLIILIIAVGVFGNKSSNQNSPE